MTITSYPFEDQDTSESQFSKLFRELQDSGVAAEIGSLDLGVSANGIDLSLSIAPGFAIVRGHAVSLAGIENVTLAAAEAEPRVDRVVLRLDPATNSITPTVIKGSAAGSPPADPPVVQTDTGVYDLPLARVLVAAAALSVSNISLTDDRRFLGMRSGIWTTANRPTSRRKGQPGYNTSTSTWEYWTGATWAPMVAGDSSRVAKAGDTMTGALSLPGDPSSAAHAARKAYVDAQRDTRVADTGDTMTGQLVFAQSGRGTSAALTNSNGRVQAVNADVSAIVPVEALAFYEGATRVYSPNNPPPPGGSVIVRTVRGVIDMGTSVLTDVTIPSVNVAKSQLRHLGERIFNEQVSAGKATITLLNATTIRAERATAAGTSLFVSYELTEWS